MNKTLCSVTALVFICSALAVYAYPVNVELTGLGGVGEFQTDVYHCANSSCSSMHYYASDFGNPTAYSLLNEGPGTQYFAEFDYKECFVPLIYRTGVSKSTCSDCSDLSISFYREPDCYAPVLSAGLSDSIVYEGERVSVNGTVRAVWLMPQGLPGVVIPPGLRANYSNHIDVFLYIDGSPFDNKTVDIVWNETGNVSFSFNAWLIPGVHTVGIYTRVDNDCECSGSSFRSLTKAITVLPLCGNGIIDASEQCELPLTFNNAFCAQTVSGCQGNKLGARDWFGDCGSSCLCTEDAFAYSCVKGSCGAECDGQNPCPNSTCEETYNDYCNNTMLAEYDNDKILDSANVTNSSPNTCLGNCLCTGNPVACPAPRLNTYCVQGVCGAVCDESTDYSLNGSTCRYGCDANESCSYQGSCSTEAYCTNNILYENGTCSASGCAFDALDCSSLNYYGDFELYCSGSELRKHRLYHYFTCSPSGCAENTEWINDILEENCGSYDGTIEEECGIEDWTCDSNSLSCQIDTITPNDLLCLNFCDAGTRNYQGACNASTYLCSYQTEDCSQHDGWYDTGNTQWADTDQCSEKEQKEQEHREYACGLGCCRYSLTGMQWSDTGSERSKENGTSCNDGLFCTVNDACSSGQCSGEAMVCSDSNECTDDLCNEGTDSCESVPDDANVCGLFRGCPFSRCIGFNWTAYPDSGYDYCSLGACIEYSCGAISSLYNATCEEDSDNDGVNDSGDICLGTPLGEIVDQNGCSCSQKTCDDGNPDTLDTCNNNTAECRNILANATAELLISEVFYNAPDNDSEKEWMEIYNPFNYWVNISGGLLSGNAGSWQLPDMLLGPHSFATMARSWSSFFSLYGCYPSRDNLTLPLSSRDMINFSWESQPIDFVSWGGFASGWDLFADTNRSIQRIQFNDTDTPGDWQNSTVPTPYCLGYMDYDDDGHNSTEDCDDNDPRTYPNATELCDGKDNDCDGKADNMPGANSSITRQCGVSDAGECRYGIRICANASWGPCTGNADPSNEVCDGKDNDCNGLADDGISCGRGGYGGGGDGGGGYICAENWTCTGWSGCSPEGRQTRTCADLSHCVSNIGKPQEIQGCTYTIPGECTANWTCSDWSLCQPNGTQTRSCGDINNCGTAEGMPPEIQTCTYTGGITGLIFGTTAGIIGVTLSLLLIILILIYLFIWRKRKK